MSVDVGRLEKDLADLWRENAKSDGDQALVRACSWNLVVHADGDAERARELVDTAVRSQPARVILLERREAGDALEAEARASCHLAGDGGKLLCSEEIAIGYGDEGERHVPPLVRALLVPDVRAALWWSGPPPRRRGCLDPLIGGIDRVIVDSGDPDVEPEHPHLEDLLLLDRRVELIDLGWLRLGPLRLLFASFFDPPVGDEPVRSAVRVHLTCGRHGAPTSMLLLGWLASRLRWGPPERVAPRRWTMPRPGGEVDVQVDVRADLDAGRDGLYELRLEAADGRAFAITDHGPGRIRLEATGLPERVVAAPEHDDAELLVAALGVRGNDPLFRESLARAVDLR